MTWPTKAMQSIRSYLFALVIAVALPLLLFSFVQTLDSAHRHRAAIEEGLLNTTRALAAGVGHELQASVAALNALGASMYLDADNLAAFYEESRRARDHHPWYSVWLADTTGRQLFSLLRPYGAELPSVEDRPYFRQVLDTRRPAISDLVVGRLTAGYHIAVAVPILRGGELKYVLAAGYRPEALSPLIASHHRGATTGVVSIVDRSHTVVARTHDAEKWIGQRGHDKYIEAIRDKSEGVSKTLTLEGEAVHTAFNRLPESGWVVGMGVPTRQVEGALWQALWETVVLGLVLLGLAMIAAVVLGRRIAEPIMALAAAVGGLAQGRPVELPHTGRVREVHALAAALGKAGEATLERDRLASELRLVFDNLREGLVTCTADGEFVYWNPAALQMHGFSRLEEARVPIADMRRIFTITTLDGEVVPFEQWPLPRILRGETVRDLELVVGRRDRRWERIYNYAGGVARNEQGKLQLALVSVSDITERKRAELALRRSEEHFRLLVEQTVDGIFLCDAHCRYLDANAAGCDMLGYKREELLRMGFEDVIEPQEIPRIASELARLEGGEIIRSEWRFRRKDGAQFYGEIAVRQLPDGRLQAILRDVTEHRQAEAALRERRDQMQELQELHVASLTAAAIAHELGQPLNAVTSYTEAALRLLRAGNLKPDRLTRALENSAEQAQRAGRVVRELLHFLRSRDIAIESVDLNEAVRKALAVVQSDGVGGFQVELDLEADLKPVLANALQVEKVLVNLLSNAVEAMRNAGLAMPSVTITIRTVADENMAHVVVRDTGPGLDEVTAKRVFEPFYTTKRRGIGMGLAISRALVEAHGGALWFELEPGPGAAFHFTLPLAT
jgi:PAS domain S-box-containing protein